ncbi:hypothetical protein C8R45DRAFT_941678 [Mycena sanguinolenta]|nr:hypothetical protein C8R45DRAFT_941678 [Mycena sanguinolenta]
MMQNPGKINMEPGFGHHQRTLGRWTPRLIFNAGCSILAHAAAAALPGVFCLEECVISSESSHCLRRGSYSGLIHIPNTAKTELLLVNVGFFNAGHNATRIARCNPDAVGVSISSRPQPLTQALRALWPRVTPRIWVGHRQHTPRSTRRTHSARLPAGFGPWRCSLHRAPSALPDQYTMTCPSATTSPCCQCDRRARTTRLLAAWSTTWLDLCTLPEPLHSSLATSVLAVYDLDSGGPANTENDSAQRTTIAGTQAPRSPAIPRRRPTPERSNARSFSAIGSIHRFQNVRFILLSIQVILSPCELPLIGTATIVTMTGGKLRRDDKRTWRGRPNDILMALVQSPFNWDLGELLYMFEITQGFYYFQNFEQDNWKHKTLVTLALLVDTLSFVSGYITVYLASEPSSPTNSLIDGYRQSRVPLQLPLGFSGLPVLALIIVFAHRLVPTVLSAQFCSVFICNLMLTLHTSLLADRVTLKIYVALWSVTEVVVNAGIASVLLWEFRKADGTLKETQSVLDRLTAVTIQSGAAAATVAGVALITYFINPESNGRFGTLLTISQLSNLNIRKSAKSVSTTEAASVPVTTGDKREPLTLTRWTTDDPCDIHVHRTVHTSVQVCLIEGPDCVGIQLDLNSLIAIILFGSHGAT